MTLSEYISIHYKEVEDGCQLRLGQRFWNDFVKHETEDELPIFYEEDDNISIWHIEKWLQKYHYFNHLPEKLERE